MADISKIVTLDNQEYDIKDATARSALGGHTIGTDVPANAVFTDTTYTDATTSSSGLMSAADKIKLNSLTNIAISDSAPSDQNINMWLDPDGGTATGIPQIDDTQISASDTFSSQKIHSNYLCFGAAQTLTETQMNQLYANMGFPTNTAGKLSYTVIVEQEES